jgi:hypothetical protein
MLVFALSHLGKTPSFLTCHTSARNPIRKPLLTYHKGGASVLPARTAHNNSGQILISHSHLCFLPFYFKFLEHAFKVRLKFIDIREVSNIPQDTELLLSCYQQSSISGGRHTLFVSVWEFLPCLIRSSSAHAC